MNIIVDAFGGDNAPLEVMKGCEMAVRDLGLEITLCGDTNILKKIAGEKGINLEGFSFIHTESVIDINDEPTQIIKGKADCSMASGLKALNENKGDAFVSAGSTGALVVGATFITKRLKGIKRPALAPLLPTAKGIMMLLDVGANSECRPEMLMQFAIMGSAYMETVMNIKNPVIGLLNIGVEETKGRPLEVESYKILSASPINFGGNIEARDLPNGDFHVVVSDGYTGNIALKLYEGMGLFFARKFKNILKKNAFSKFGSLFMLKDIKAFKKEIDTSEIGGAVLIGVSKPVIKAHGNSNAKAFFSAIKQAKACAENKVIDKIRDTIVKG